MEYYEGFVDYHLLPDENKIVEEDFKPDYFAECLDLIIKFRDIDRKNRPFEIFKHINVDDLLRFFDLEE